MFRNLIRKSCSAIKALITRRVEICCDGIPYNFERVPIKKILNWIRVEASIYVKPKRPWGLPTHLQIEPSNCCNLHCALCPVTTGMDRPLGHMNPELFKRIIDETGEYVFLILLWDWGEPFLNPHVYEMIAYAREKGVRIVSSTNGHRFAQTEEAERVVRSGLDTLIFAMDGITQESYEHYRQGGRLETVIDGIRKVVAQKQALGSSTPLVNLRFIVMKHNEHEIPEVKNLAESLGVDALTFRTMCPLDNLSHREEVSDTEFTPQNAFYQRFRRDAGTGERIRRERNSCKALWNNPVIHWNGVVCPCTFDPDERHPLGDLRNENLKAVWRSERYRSLRSQFRTDYRKIDVCSECTNAYEGGACSTEDIVEAYFFR